MFKSNSPLKIGVKIMTKYVVHTHFLYNGKSYPIGTEVSADVVKSNPEFAQFCKVVNEGGASDEPAPTTRTTRTKRARTPIAPTVNVVEDVAGVVATETTAVGEPAEYEDDEEQVEGEAEDDESDEEQVEDEAEAEDESDEVKEAILTPEEVAKALDETDGNNKQLIEDHQITIEQLATVKPSGKNGGFLKKDIVDILGHDI